MNSERRYASWAWRTTLRLLDAFQCATRPSCMEAAMRLFDRRVVGSNPVMYVGRREYKARDGSRRQSRTWAAVWCYHGKQGARTLRTQHESEAIEKAHQ